MLTNVFVVNKSHLEFDDSISNTIKMKEQLENQLLQFHRFEKNQF